MDVMQLLWFLLRLLDGEVPCPGKVHYTVPRRDTMKSYRDTSTAPRDKAYASLIE